MEIEEENLFPDRTEEEIAKDKPVKEEPKEDKEEETYTPYIASGRRVFKEGDSLDPKIRTDSDGRVWLKLKDED